MTATLILFSFAAGYAAALLIPKAWAKLRAWLVAEADGALVATSFIGTWTQPTTEP